MAVAFVFEASGVDAAAYDATMKGIGREAVEADVPDGILSHLSGPTANGWFVVDVWESEAQAGAFYGSESFQSAVQANLPVLEPRVVPLHRLEVYKTLRSIT